MNRDMGTTTLSRTRKLQKMAKASVGTLRASLASNSPTLYQKPKVNAKEISTKDRRICSGGRGQEAACEGTSSGLGVPELCLQLHRGRGVGGAQAVPAQGSCRGFAGLYGC